MEMFSQFNCMQNPKSRLSNNKGRARTVVLLFAQQTRGHVWPLNLFCLLEPQYRYAEKQITDIIGLVTYSYWKIVSHRAKSIFKQSAEMRPPAPCSNFIIYKIETPLLKEHTQETNWVIPSSTQLLDVGRERLSEFPSCSRAFLLMLLSEKLYKNSCDNDNRALKDYWWCNIEAAPVRNNLFFELTLLFCYQYHHLAKRVDGIIVMTHFCYEMS